MELLACKFCRFLLKLEILAVTNETKPSFQRGNKIKYMEMKQMFIFIYPIHSSKLYTLHQFRKSRRENNSSNCPKSKKTWTKTYQENSKDIYSSSTYRAGSRAGLDHFFLFHIRMNEWICIPQSFENLRTVGAEVSQEAPHNLVCSYLSLNVNSASLFCWLS